MTTANGSKVATYNAADGTRLLVWQNGPRAGTDRGTWRIDGDKWCSSFQNLRGGAEACFIFVKRGDTYLTINVADKSEIQFTVDQGDTTGRM